MRGRPAVCRPRLRTCGLAKNGGVNASVTFARIARLGGAVTTKSGTLWYVVWGGQQTARKQMIEGIVRGGLTAPDGYNTQRLEGMVALSMRGWVEREYRDVVFGFPHSHWKIKKLVEL